MSSVNLSHFTADVFLHDDPAGAIDDLPVVGAVAGGVGGVSQVINRVGVHISGPGVNGAADNDRNRNQDTNNQLHQRKPIAPPPTGKSNRSNAKLPSQTHNHPTSCNIKVYTTWQNRYAQQNISVGNILPKWGGCQIKLFLNNLPGISEFREKFG